MTPHSINDEKNFISGWYIDTELCDSIVELCSGRNRLKFNGEPKSSFKGYLGCPLTKLSTELQAQYQSELAKVVNLYIEEYPFLTEVEEFSHWDELVQIQVYDPGYSYSKLHCENSGRFTEFDKRCLVFMTYLNDINDGGGTYFPHQNVTTKAEKGLTLVWPAYWTHPHNGVVSQTERKIIATGWFEFQKK